MNAAEGASSDIALQKRHEVDSEERAIRKNFALTSSKNGLKERLKLYRPDLELKLIRLIT